MAVAGGSSQLYKQKTLVAVTIPNDPPTHRTDLPKKAMMTRYRIPLPRAQVKGARIPRSFFVVLPFGVKGVGIYSTSTWKSTTESKEAQQIFKKTTTWLGQLYQIGINFRDPKKNHGKHFGFRLSWHPPRYEIKERHGRHLADTNLSF